MDNKEYLGKEVEIIIDRPLGSKHPKHNYKYKVNYGYIPGTKSPDGEELDAYVLGEKKPLKTFKGVCIAIVQRTDDNDDKLIVVPEGLDFTDDEIEKQIEFQEKWFKHELIR